MQNTHYIKLFLAPVLWGGGMVAGRIATASLPPFTIAFIRFTLVSLFLIPFLHRKEGRFPRPTRAELLLLVVLSLSGMLLFNVFLFYGLQTVTAVRSAVIIAFTPAVVALLSGLFFKEKITLCMSIGILCAFVGVVITVSNGSISLILKGGISTGDLFLLGSVAAWTVFTIITKFAVRNLKPLTVLTYGSLLGAILLIPFTIWEGGLGELSRQAPEAWISLLYLSVGAAGIAYLWYYEGIKAVGVSRAAIFLNLEPVSAIILGICILGEQLSLPVTIGALLVVGGLVLTNYKR